MRKISILMLVLFSFTFSEELNLDNMVFIEGEVFKMGSNGEDDEKPVHKVTVSSFYMGKYEVTQKEWKEIMGSNHSCFKGDNRPVEHVYWSEAVEFCNKLSEKEGLEKCYSGKRDSIVCDFSKNGYRLPTEAEWEYAARGGNKSEGYKYAGSDNLDEVAWYWKNSIKNHSTHPVGQKNANELGLYDMTGNVSEWCWDRYRSDYYRFDDNINPTGSIWPSSRVFRGESWLGDAFSCRVTNRGSSSSMRRKYNRGFRVVKSKITPNDSIDSTLVTKDNRVKNLGKMTSNDKIENDNMVLVEGGTFMMGSHEGRRDEKPVHNVRVNSFYMSKYEITNAEYCKFLNVMGNQTEGGAGARWLNIYSYFCQIKKVNGTFVPKLGKDNYPVICVTWYGARAYCKWKGGRLPTEAEWEYAARGGKKSKGYKYAGSNKIEEVGWYDGNSHNSENNLFRDRGTYPVGQKKPNELGLYDMSGNVYEWCDDKWHNDYNGAPVDGSSWRGEGSKHVIRGGGWGDNPGRCRVAFRSSRRRILEYIINGCVEEMKGGGSNDVGFRMVKSKIIPDDSIACKTSVIKDNIAKNISTISINDSSIISDKMVFVEGGTFKMGSNNGEYDEKPVHSVTVSSFYMGKYEVTHKEFIDFLNDKGVNSDGSYNGREIIDMDDENCTFFYKDIFYFKGSYYVRSENYPVIEVTCYGAMEYCKWLSSKTGKKYRLPTEAEWEYAARGGKKSKRYEYAGSNNVDDVGWCYLNSCGNIHPVGQKKSNELGLYDMSGNVWEWCNDWYGEKYYDESKDSLNPIGPRTGSTCVYRGGSWDNGDCRVADRDDGSLMNSDYTLGFRLVRSK